MSEQTTEVIEKAEVNPITKVPRLKEVSQPHIVVSGQRILDQRQKDLKHPYRYKTFKLMMEDSYVADPCNSTMGRVATALADGCITYNKDSDESKEWASFIEYNLHNMRYGTWLQACTHASTDLINGLSLLNIVAKKRNYGSYAGMRCLDKLSPRPVQGIQSWVYNKDRTELVGVLFKPNLLADREPAKKTYQRFITESTRYDDKYVFVPIESLLHFRHIPKDDNPEGDSPFLHFYNTWQEVRIIENLELQGMQKDLVGTGIIRVAQEVLDAADDPEDPAHDKAKQFLEEIQTDVNKLLEGIAGGLVMSSETDEKGNLLYDLNIKGIDGGGKQYTTTDVIRDKKTSIYNNFSSGHTILGQSGDSGSEALSLTKLSDHDIFISQILRWKVDVINNDLIPRLLAVNGIYPSHEDMPKFKPARINNIDWETISKAAQRFSSVERDTKGLMSRIYEELDIDDKEGLDDLYDNLVRNNESKSGTGMGTSGQGSGSQEMDGNLENKSFYIDDDDGEFLYIRTESMAKAIKVAKND